MINYKISIGNKNNETMIENKYPQKIHEMINNKN